MKRLFSFKDSIFHFPAALVSFLLLIPLVLFLTQIKGLSWAEDLEFLSVIGWTFFQALAATGLIFLFSFLGVRGLLTLVSKKYYFLIEAFVVLPSLIPSLILVISVANLLELFMPFPFGLGSLIFFQVLTYTGLCSVVWSRVLSEEISQLSEWAYIHDLSSWKFLKYIMRTFLRKDIKTLMTLIFISAFTSLSLPLLTAGGRGVSLEFFIYEQLKDPDAWPVATFLILLQTVLIFYIYIKAFSPTLSSSFNFYKGKIYLIPKKIMLIIPLFPSLISVFGLFFISDFKKNFLKIIDLDFILWSSLLHSFLLGLGVGSLVLVFFIMMSLSFRSSIFRKFVVAFMYPGVTLVGFAFLILPFYSLNFVLLKWIFGLSLLLFPIVYRLRGEVMLEKLTDQVEMTRLLGGSWLFVFSKILWPQSRSVFFLCAGLSAFLACGDFSYSLIVSQGHWNMALLTYDLFSSYRLDLALLASWFLLILSLLVFLFWIGVSFVFDKKFKLQH
ncbi:MAG: hypothetical protein ACR2M7_02070 [Bdellovibrionales bacterium]